MKSTLQLLYNTIHKRVRPEDVAQIILDTPDNQLPKKAKRQLESIAHNSLKTSRWHYSSMPEDFFRPVGAQRVMARVGRYFPLPAIAEHEFFDPAALRQYVAEASAHIHKTYGNSNFLNQGADENSHRLNTAQREALGLDLSRRQYNKRFRVLKDAEWKIGQLQRENLKFELRNVARHGLVHRLGYDAFAANFPTACFIAYYTARCNLRTQFTITGQTRPFDEIAQTLLGLCHPETANWGAIAYVYPHPDVLKRLSENQKGDLLGQWMNMLADIGQFMQQLISENKYDLKNLVVKRGDDSEAWNITAGAWNKARDNWTNLVYSLGLEDLLNTLCFGKVMRLMAADIVAWHRSAGQKADPNEAVWNQLPRPWDVLAGNATCTRAQIEAACAATSPPLDPYRTGWLAPRPNTAVAKSTPTPELVYGVEVTNPFLAKMLKQEGVFAGHKSKAKVSGFLKKFRMN